jgi:hypothetical protein
MSSRRWIMARPASEEVDFEGFGAGERQRGIPWLKGGGYISIMNFIAGSAGRSPLSRWHPRHVILTVCAG